MNRKLSIGDRIFDGFNIIILTLLSFSCLYPLLYVLFASLSEPTKLIAHQGILFSPLGFTLEGYKMTFRDGRILSGYINTIIYVVGGTFLSIVFTSIGAYVLSRKKLYYTKYVMYAIVFTMFFNGGLIPFYLMMKKLNLYNTRWAVILPGVILTWNLIIMRTSFSQLPDSLEESARVDGASHLNILFRIIIPVSKPVIAVMILFYSVGKWNEWFNASILIRDTSKYPLQVVLRDILISDNQTNMFAGSTLNAESQEKYKQLLQYCTIIVATAPILCVYPLVQKHFVKGIMIGAIKG